MKRLEIALTVLAATIHLCFCCAIRFNMVGVDGNWGWMYAFIVDFPVSLIILPLMRQIDPLLAFGVLGTIWWVIIAKGVALVISYFEARIRAKL